MLTWVLWIQRPAIDMRLSRKLGSHRGGPPVSSGRSRGCVGIVPRDLPCHWAKLGAWSWATANCLPKRAAQSNGLLHCAMQRHQAKLQQGNTKMREKNPPDPFILQIRRLMMMILAVLLRMMSPFRESYANDWCPNLQVNVEQRRQWSQVYRLCKR